MSYRVSPEKFGDGLLRLWTAVRDSPEFQTEYQKFFGELTDGKLLSMPEAHHLKRLHETSQTEAAKLYLNRELSKLRKSISNARIISFSHIGLSEVFADPNQFLTKEQIEKAVQKVIHNLRERNRYKEPVVQYYVRYEREVRKNADYVFDEDNPSDLGRLSYWIRFAQENHLEPAQLQELFDEVEQIKEYPEIKLLVGKTLDQEIDLDDTLDAGSVFSAALYRKAYRLGQDPNGEREMREHFRKELYLKTYIPSVDTEIPGYGSVKQSRYLQDVYQIVWNLKTHEDVLNEINGGGFRPIQARKLLENYYSAIQHEKVTLDPKAREAGGKFGPEVKRWEDGGLSEIQMERNLIRRARLALHWNQQIIRVGSETIRFIKLPDGTLEVERLMDGNKPVASKVQPGEVWQAEMGEVGVRIDNAAAKGKPGIQISGPQHSQPGLLVSHDEFSVYRVEKSNVFVYGNSDDINDLFVNGRYDLLLSQGFDLADPEGLNNGRLFLDRLVLRAGVSQARRELLPNFLKSGQFKELSQEDLTGILLMSDKLNREDERHSLRYVNKREAQEQAVYDARQDIIEMRDIQYIYDHVLLVEAIRAADTYYKKVYPYHDSHGMLKVARDGEKDPVREEPRKLTSGEIGARLILEREDGRSYARILKYIRDWAHSQHLDQRAFAAELIQLVLKDPELIVKLRNVSHAGMSDEEIAKKWAHSAPTLYITEPEQGAKVRYYEKKQFNDGERTDWVKTVAIVQYYAYKYFGGFLPNLYDENHLALTYRSTLGPTDQWKTEMFGKIMEQILGKSLEQGDIGPPGYDEAHLIREVYKWLKTYFNFDSRQANGKVPQFIEWFRRARGPYELHNGKFESGQGYMRIKQLLERADFIWKLTLEERGEYEKLGEVETKSSETVFITWMRGVLPWNWPRQLFEVYAGEKPKPQTMRENLPRQMEGVGFETMKVYMGPYADLLGKGRDREFRNITEIESLEEERRERSSPELAQKMDVRRQTLQRAQTRARELEAEVREKIRKIDEAYQQNVDPRPAVEALRELLRSTEDRVELLAQIRVLAKLKAENKFEYGLYEIPHQRYQQLEEKLWEIVKPKLREGIEYFHKSTFDYLFQRMVEKGLGWNDLAEIFELEYQFEPFVRLVSLIESSNPDQLGALSKITEDRGKTAAFLALLVGVKYNEFDARQLSRELAKFGVNLPESTLQNLYRSPLWNKEKGSLGFYAEQMDEWGLPAEKAARHYAYKSFIKYQEVSLVTDVLIEIGERLSGQTQAAAESGRESLRRILLNHYGEPAAAVSEEVLDFLVKNRLLDGASVNQFKPWFRQVYGELKLEIGLDELGSSATQAIRRDVTSEEIKLAYGKAVEGWHVWVHGVDFSNGQVTMSDVMRMLQVHRYMTDQLFNLGIGLGERPPEKHLELPVLMPVQSRIKEAELAGDFRLAEELRSKRNHLLKIMTDEVSQASHDTLLVPAGLDEMARRIESNPAFEFPSEKPDTAAVRKSLEQIVELRRAIEEISTKPGDTTRLEGVQFHQEQISRFLLHTALTDVLPYEIRFQVERALKFKHQVPQQVAGNFEYEDSSHRQKTQDFSELQRLMDQKLAPERKSWISVLFLEYIEKVVRKAFNRRVIFDIDLKDDQYLVYTELYGLLLDPIPEVRVDGEEIIFRYVYAGEPAGTIGADANEVRVKRSEALNQLIAQGAPFSVILSRLADNERKRVGDLYESAIQTVLGKQGMDALKQLKRGELERLGEAAEEATELFYRVEEEDEFNKLHRRETSDVEYAKSGESIRLKFYKQSKEGELKPVWDVLGKRIGRLKSGGQGETAEGERTFVGELSVRRTPELDRLANEKASAQALLIHANADEKDKANKLFEKSGELPRTELNFLHYAIPVLSWGLLAIGIFTASVGFIALVFWKRLNKSTRWILEGDERVQGLGETEIKERKTEIEGFERE